MLAAIASQGCALKYWLGVRLLYDTAPAPVSARLDVAYDPAAPDDPKRRLDLYLPAGRDFPTVVFVHGGGWTWGDRQQTAGGADIYRNIGRFLAAQGIGAAVIGYRLVWTVDWPEQLGDVARAVAWVQAHVGEHGGHGDRVFLLGHSAGAQLAARIAVDPAWLARAGGDAAGVCGVAAVSGAGYDLGDLETYRRGFDPRYFSERFGGSRMDGSWWHDASVLPWIDAADPPFLVVSATGEHGGLQRQSRLLYDRLTGAGVAATMVSVKGSGHERIVLELSRADKTAGPAVLRFVRDTPCPRSVSASGGAARDALVATGRRSTASAAAQSRGLSPGGM